MLIDRVTRIWERVLGHPRIGANDNFFAIGGSAGLARELFDELRREGIGDITPAMIYAAPTIASLVEIIERPGSHQLPAVVVLREGAGYPAVFMAHGVGSSALELHELAHRLDTDRPVYGLQAKGTGGFEEPHDRIEDMAEFFSEAIRKIQSEGPYHLIGYSFGGLVMLEIARILRNNGETADVVMVDSYPNKKYLRVLPFLRLAFRVGIKRSLGLFKGTWPKKRGHRLAADHYQMSQSYVALAHYPPRPYDGKVRFLKASKFSDFPQNPMSVWGHWIPNFTVETIPGDHFEMLELHPELLARALSLDLIPTSDSKILSAK